MVYFFYAYLFFQERHAEVSSLMRNHRNILPPHASLDDTLLEQGWIIADMLDQEPAAVANIALENIERWKKHDSICELHLVWERALRAGKWREIRQVLTGDGERERQFRQTMPFTDTLFMPKKGENR